MFRQDHRINKIFLPFQTPARRGLPSGLEALRVGSGTGGKKSKRNFVFSASSGSREKNQVNPVNPVRKYFGFMSK